MKRLSSRLFGQRLNWEKPKEIIEKRKKFSKLKKGDLNQALFYSAKNNLFDEGKELILENFYENNLSENTIGYYLQKLSKNGNHLDYLKLCKKLELNIAPYELQSIGLEVSFRGVDVEMPSFEKEKLNQEEIFYLTEEDSISSIGKLRRMGEYKKAYEMANRIGYTKEKVQINKELNNFIQEKEKILKKLKKKMEKPTFQN